MLTGEQVAAVHVEVEAVRRWLVALHRQLAELSGAGRLSDQRFKAIRDESLRLADRLDDLGRRLWWHTHAPEQLGG
jgi:hypothetical protein